MGDSKYWKALFDLDWMGKKAGKIKYIKWALKHREGITAAIYEVNNNRCKGCNEEMARVCCKIKRGNDMTCKWYGYQYTSGDYQAKRFFDDLDIIEARESPFVSGVTEVFEAEGRDEALKIVKERL